MRSSAFRKAVGIRAAFFVLYKQFGKNKYLA